MHDLFLQFFVKHEVLRKGTILRLFEDFGANPEFWKKQRCVEREVFSSGWASANVLCSGPFCQSVEWFLFF